MKSIKELQDIIENQNLSGSDIAYLSILDNIKYFFDDINGDEIDTLFWTIQRVWLKDDSDCSIDRITYFIYTYMVRNALSVEELSQVRTWDLLEELYWD